MKQLLHLKTMLVTLLTMLVAMNASAQTQNYFSCNFDNYTDLGNLKSNGWTYSGKVTINGNNPYRYGSSGKGLQLGTTKGASGQATTPALNTSLPSDVQLSFYAVTGGYNNVSLTVTVVDGGKILDSDNKTSESVTISIANGSSKFYNYNLTGCTSKTKIKFYANKICAIDEIKVTDEASSDWKYDPASVNVTYGDNFTAPVLNINGYNGAITYTNSNESVATVDASSGVVAINAVGETTITARGEDTQNPAAGEASYTLIVKDIQGSATGGSGASVFKEAFSKTDGTGGGGEGNENSWKGDVARSTVVPDEKDWTFSSSKGGGDHCVKLGKSGGKGYAMTRYIDVEIGKTYTLTFRAAPWDKENANMIVSVTDGCDFSGIINKENMTPNYWNYYTATITPNTVNRIRIKFEASKDRFFLDEINVAAPSTSETVNVTIPSSGWGTFCYKYPLDFTAASTPEGLKAYAVSATTTSKATLTQITEKIIGGTGIIINGTPGATYTIKVADQGTQYSGNLLTGTLAPTYVEEGQYFLKSGQFVYSSAGILPEKKAYLKKENAPEAAANFGFVVEDATGISEVRNNITLDDDKWYDLSGRAVSPTSKGIYIHNGKKYVIK